MTFKRWPHNKHDSRMRIGQLERYSTVNALEKRECIMFNGDCDCEFIQDCKYIKPDDHYKEEK